MRVDEDVLSIVDVTIKLVPRAGELCFSYCHRRCRSDALLIIADDEELIKQVQTVPFDSIIV